jgi:ATP-binding cassette subfamily B protein
VYGDVALYRRALRDARPYWGHIATIFLLNLLATPLALLSPVPLMIAVDSGVRHEPLPGPLRALVPASIEHSPTGAITLAALMVVVVKLASELQSLSTDLLRTYTGEKLTLALRSRLFRHVQRLSLAYHDRRGTADANYRIHSDASSVQAIAIDGVIPFVAAGFTLAGMLYVTVRISPLLAVVALVVAPPVGVLTWLYRRRLKERHREVKRLESSALSIVQETLLSLRLVKAFGQEEREARRFVDRSGWGTAARIRVAMIDGSFGVLIAVVTAVGSAAVLVVGFRQVQSGAITLGSQLLVMGYLSQLYRPLSSMSKKVAKLQSAFVSAERIFSLLDELPDVPQRPGAYPLPRAAGRVEFRNVSFAYDRDRPVLAHVSFEVGPGGRVGIAGRTGAGKSTLMNLLTRFYDPTEGAILLDAVDLREYRLADLRNQFAIVLQEPVLLSATIAENIAYGRPAAKLTEIIEASKAADIHHFVRNLPDRYDTQVGERGMTLSGGERQRICIARAFLKDAPILILDEPTSSVDLTTESTIMEALERLMVGRTTFVIGHRLSTLDACNLRLQVDEGRVAATPAARVAAAR